MNEFYVEGRNDIAAVRDCLNAIDAAGFAFAYHGEFNGNEFRQEYKFSDFDIRLENENLDFVDEELHDPETGETLVLSKPLLVLYSQYEQSSSPRVQGNLAMEWQIIVNAPKHGRLHLDGYSQLCQSIFQYDDVAQAAVGRFWSEYGLLPRSFQLSNVYDGEILAVELKNRLLCRMARCIITVL